jgi:phosphatidylglycerophosphatase A
VKAARFVLSYFGFGLVPVAPGTFGALGAALTAWAILEYAPGWADRSYLLCGIWILVSSVLTVLLTPAVEELTGKKDPSAIVMDEVCGYWATLLFVGRLDLPLLAAAFLLARYLDVLKPWPARALERLPSGWGVLLDDLAAGLIGGGILWAVDAGARALAGAAGAA